MIILTGKIQSGKSTLAMKLAMHLKQENKQVSGIIAKGLWKNNLRQGFDLVDLSNNKQAPLARLQNSTGKKEVTPFKFFDSGLDFGSNALDKRKCSNAEVIIVDEIGKLELRGEGWASLLNPLLSIKSATHIWIIRESLVDEVCNIWKLKNMKIVNVNEENALNRLKLFCLK